MQQTIGQKLKTAREKAGLSLLDAAHETCIPTNRLQLLETDNMAAFGSMAYARSFLKNYSAFLEVDASEELDQFPSPVFGGPEDYHYLTRSHGPWVRRKIRHQPPAPLSRGRHSPVLGIVGLVSVLVITSALVSSQLLGWQKPGQVEEVTGVVASHEAEALTPAPVATEAEEQIEEEALPDLGLETIVRPAVIPSSIPARVSSETPVRRPEIVE